MKFSDATFKLTSLYILILLVISAFFSANLYRISIQEVDQSFARQSAIINSSPRLSQLTLDPEFNRVRHDAYEDAKAKLLASLLFTNMIIITIGGALSYLFARKTLQPIEEIHEAQVRFTADASHELRTPISVMRSEIEVANKNKNLTVEEAREVFSSNIEEIDRLTLLINSLLQLARLEDETVDRKPVKLNAIFSEVENNMAKLAAAKKIALQFTNTNTKVLCNSEYTTQAIGIIVDNAIKYSPEKSKVNVNSTSAGNTVYIDISDEGTGIEAKDVQKIFERFYRADNSRTKQRVEGHGLGLSIARAIVEKQGGKLELATTSKRGTTFRISLPQA